MLAAAVLVAVTVGVAVFVAGERGSEDGATEAAADLTSAARGPQGTRTLTEVPEEIPVTVLTGDAAQLEGTVARGGDDWSAVVTFVSHLEPAEVETTVDAALRTAAFAHRQASFDGHRRVIVYDGEDGSVLTVTLTFGEGPVTVGVVRISP
ncbi:hypothetical protein [Nitriliruptor alkaliphilus]|uniref:hypothetical protein n=1 Tax=Nitriliruptor alkaliphilus TaxID=427918 RepID=UPI000697F90C|nr:hypothetical protein [Nitriliruptor alkaliphilus]